MNYHSEDCTVVVVMIRRNFDPSTHRSHATGFSVEAAILIPLRAFTEQNIFWASSPSIENCLL